MFKSRAPLLLAFFFFCSLVSAQHIVRNRAFIASSLIELTPISNVEILPISQTTTTINEFTLSQNGPLFVHAVSFHFNQALPQIPFACAADTAGGVGGAQQLCRATPCYLSCKNNDTYSVALQCFSSSSSSSSSWRLVAISQDPVSSYDDPNSITLEVKQRFVSGQVCRFVFAHQLLGRNTTNGRLRGSVSILAGRSFPFGSNVPFHPHPLLWNQSASFSSNASSFFSSSSSGEGGAYVRCSTNGVVTYVASPNSTTTTSSTSNWTSACCYDAAGKCTVSYTGTNPSFYLSSSLFPSSSTTSSSSTQSEINDKYAVSRSHGKTIFAKVANGITTSANLESSCASSGGRSFQLNVSSLTHIAPPSSSSSLSSLGTSLFSILQTTTAMGVFTCFNDSSTNPLLLEMICVAFASNRSIIAFPPNSNFSGVVVVTSSSSSPSSLIPVCETNSTYSSILASTAGSGSQILFPADDASNTESTNSDIALPHGPCLAIKSKARCVSPCIWSPSFGVCLWSDSFETSSTSSTSIRSVTCLWDPLPNASTTVFDLRCRLASSKLSLSALLARLCLQRGFAASEITWCVQSAFACSLQSESPEVFVDSLMSHFCDAKGICIDSGLGGCLPNGTTAAPPPPPAFVLSTVQNHTTSINVRAQIRHNPSGFVSIAFWLVATGAYFNLTAIRLDLARRVGFDVVVPAGSSNFGRFSLANEFPKLFPDSNFAITEVYDRPNITITNSLVLRISTTRDFMPLAGTEQYLDITPQTSFSSSSSSSSSPSSSSSTDTSQISHDWLTPSQFTFSKIRIVFKEPDYSNAFTSSGDAIVDSSCSVTGLSIATSILGLLSGFGGWLNVAAVQATLLGAHSTCAPIPVSRCFQGTEGIVSPAKWMWQYSRENLDRKVFWTQFLIVVVALLLHLFLLRVYVHFAPLKGSPEQTLWFPAPVFYLSGLLAVGTVQAAWIVIFSDEQAALRVVSFFCFAALVGTILPWWFLKTFRQQENYFRRNDYTDLLRKIDQNYGAGEDNTNNNNNNNNNNNKQDSEEMQSQQQHQHQHQNQQHPQHHHHHHGETKTKQKLNAETVQISLGANKEQENKLKAARKKWNSPGERCTYFLFTFVLPSGSWPHTRGMSPVRDLLHPDAKYFSWVSLVILGFCGLNFSYVGVSQNLCRANYANMAALQGIWIACTLWWRPFRVPVLTVLFTLARLLDFIDSIISADWISGATPDEETAIRIRRIKVASLVFMLIFSIITFIVKINEVLTRVVQRSDEKMEEQKEEKTLDQAIAAMKLKELELNNSMDGGSRENSPIRQLMMLGGSGASHLHQQARKRGGEEVGVDLVTPLSPIRAPPVTVTVPSSRSPSPSPSPYYSSSSPRHVVTAASGPMNLRASLKQNNSNNNNNNVHSSSSSSSSTYQVESNAPELRTLHSKNPNNYRRLQIWWDDHHENKNLSQNEIEQRRWLQEHRLPVGGGEDEEEGDGDTTSSSSSSSRVNVSYLQVNQSQRSQKLANLLSTFGSLLRVQELTGPAESFYSEARERKRSLLLQQKEERKRNSQARRNKHSNNNNSNNNNNNNNKKKKQRVNPFQHRRRHHHHQEEEEGERQQGNHQQYDLDYLDDNNDYYDDEEEQDEEEEELEMKDPLSNLTTRIIATFSDPRDAESAFMALNNRTEEDTGARLVCQLVPEPHEIKEKRQAEIVAHEQIRKEEANKYSLSNRLARRLNNLFDEEL